MFSGGSLNSPKPPKFPLLSHKSKIMASPTRSSIANRCYLNTTALRRKRLPRCSSCYTNSNTNFFCAFGGLGEFMDAPAHGMSRNFSQKKAPKPPKVTEIWGFGGQFFFGEGSGWNLSQKKAPKFLGFGGIYGGSHLVRCPAAGRAVR